MTSTTQARWLKIARGVVFGLVCAALWTIGLTQQQPTALPLAAASDLRSLPNNLATLQEATGYLGWEHVR